MDQLRTRAPARTLVGSIVALIAVTCGSTAWAIDTDGDGLEDADETTTWGTNPALWDTDGDGVHDGLEALHSPTDPLDPDSDDDGLLDGEERWSASGFGPLRPIPTGVSVALADIDGQGGLDLGYSTQDGAGYRLNQVAPGQPDFGPLVIITAVPAAWTHNNPAGTLFLDVDGDGDADLVRNERIEGDPTWPGDDAVAYENRISEATADFAAGLPFEWGPLGWAALHDFNGNGLLDGWLAGGWGGFAWSPRLPPSMPPRFETSGGFVLGGDPSYGFSHAVVDIDGDGDLDALFASAFGEPAIVWNENRLDQPSADFTPATALATFEGRVMGFAVANVDETPAPELIVLATGPDEESGWLELRLEIRPNPFDLRRRKDPALPIVLYIDSFDPLAVGDVHPMSIETGDVDGDGDLDIVTDFGAVFGEISWIENRLSERIPRVGPRRSIAPAWYKGRPSLRDLDGDGDLDLFSASFQGGPGWLENVFNHGSDPLVQDTDGDGLLDGDEVHTHGTHPGRADTDGDGLSDDEELGVLGTDPLDPDSDGDGLKDGEERMPQAFRVAYTAETGTPCCYVAPLEFGPNLELADIDGDGDPDLLLGTNDFDSPWLVNRLGEVPPSIARPDSGGANSYIVKNAGSGWPTFALARTPEGAPLAALASGYMAGEVYWHPAYPTLAYRGFVGFDWASVLVGNATTEAIRLHPVDLDGDGDQDVLVADHGAGEVEWYENRLDEPSADFAPVRVIDAAAGGVEDTYPADLDGDGDLDVLVGAHDAAEIRWFENRLDEPSADFAPAVVVNDDAVDVWRLHAVDFDGDGDLDPVATSIYGYYVVWYENRIGEGEPFVARQVDASPLGWNGALAIDGGDLDRDGDDDLVFVHGLYDGELVTVLSDGASSVVDAEVTPLGATYPGDVELADLDGDGDLDAAVTAGGWPGVAIWLENRINFATAVDDPDSDGDGLQDGFEVEWGENPLAFTDPSADTDGDGLDLLAEQAANTSPLSDDTDGDGVTDNVELAEGTDPLDRLDVPETPVPEFDAGGLVVLVLAFVVVAVRRLRAHAPMAAWPRFAQAPSPCRRAGC